MNSGICGTNKCDLSIHSIELEMSDSHFITLINHRSNVSPLYLVISQMTFGSEIRTECELMRFNRISANVIIIWLPSAKST